MTEQITPEALASLLRREYDNADNYRDQLRVLEDQAFAYYEAQPFGNEMEGRSSVVLPDVQEVLDDTAASLLRIFASGDRTVEFEAVNEGDEEAAEDATSAIEYNFMRKQDGYGVLNDVIQDGNLRKIGIFKTVVDVQEKVSRHWEVMPADALEMVASESDVEDVREFEGQNPETGEPMQMVRALIKEEKTETSYNLVAVPTDEFRFSPSARHEDTADYVSHAKPCSRSDLVSMGFDRDQVYSLPAYDDNINDHTESEELDNYIRDETSEALVKVLLCEDYARVDVDGDGIAERIQAWRVGNEILRWQGEAKVDELGEPELDEDGEPLFEEGELAVETVDEQPFAVYCPFPRPHRLIGYSLADKVMDIQYGRSYIARQLFDGMAFANMPRHEVAEDGETKNTMGDLLSVFPGSPVRVKRSGAVTPLSGGFDINQSLQAMEWLSREKEGRSGSGRATPVAGEDALNNMTATEFNGRQSKGETLQEYVARNLAEAFARGCAKLYRLMRLEAAPFNIKVDGKYREVDPSSWPEDMNMRVRVGLGTNNKDKRVQARMALYQPMTLAIENGLAGPEHAFKWMDGIARDTNIGQGEDFMYDPSDPEVQQRMAAREQGPDPEVQMKQAEMQAKQQEAQARLQLDAQKAQAASELDRAKAEAAIQTEREKHALQMQAARERAALEMELARDKTAAEIDLAREKMAAEVMLKQQTTDANMTDQRMGGSVAS